MGLFKKGNSHSNWGTRGGWSAAIVTQNTTNVQTKQGNTQTKDNQPIGSGKGVGPIGVYSREEEESNNTNYGVTANEVEENDESFDPQSDTCRDQNNESERLLNRKTAYNRGLFEYIRTSEEKSAKVIADIQHQLAAVQEENTALEDKLRQLEKDLISYMTQN
ncbi:hypothetical protein TRICI_002337 [Trichomonascus ciferrii]|uniref:Uncharacterized protein n=1 Tax=Trichomonascus ciferrii TaxID=44093 RepID=A0A6A1LUZ7_9ASCO|nr:hypothetical protein TRICI_002337 [Trichomonascus ciferrii]